VQTFGDLDILSIVRKCQLNCIGHVNRMDSKIKLSDVFINNNPQGSRLKRRPKIDGGNVYKQILISAKLKTGKRGKKHR
jgi:hypothetical protein